MAYTNANGQTRVGVRSPQVAPVVTVSTLLTGIYSIWDGDISGSSLDTSIYGAWNGDGTVTTLNTSLIGAWNGNSNTNDSIGSNNGTAVGGLTYSTGKVGNAFTFNGTNSYVSLPDNSLSFTGDFSISMWINMATTGQSAYIIDSAQFSGMTSGWVLLLASGNLQFNTYNNNNMVALSANYVLTSANTWYHVAVTSRSGYTAIYINNSLISWNTSTQRPNYLSGPYSIPKIGVFKTGNYQFFNGKIDGLSTWNKELSIDEITALYNSGNGIEAPYSTSISVSSANDSVSTNHGTLNGGITYTTGKIGNAFQFNGSNSYVSFPTNSWNSLVGTDLTISLWVKLASTANQTLISNMSTPSVNVWNGWEIRIVSGQPIFYSWNNSGTGQGVVGSTLTTNTWYNIVATKRGTSYKIYINGSLYASSIGTGDAVVSGTFYPNIGHLQYSSTYHGLYTTNGSIIDAVNLWSRELSLTEVSALYNAGNGTQYPYSSQTLAAPSNKLGIDNGTLMNGCSIVPGKIGNAFSFDGINDYVSLPSNSMNFTGDFSISFWWYYNNDGQPQCLMSNADYISGGGAQYGWYIFQPIPQVGNKTTNLPLQFSIGNGTTRVNLDATVRDNPFVWYSNNTWYHFVITRKAGQRTRMYRNGVLDTSNTSTFDPTYLTTTKPTIGGLFYQSYSSSILYPTMAGNKLDAVNVWNKELTQAEVTELYNSGNGKQLDPTSIVSSGLVLNLDASRKSSYPNTGTTWYDISGNGYNGTMLNGVAYGTTASGVMTFDGVNDYVDLDNVLNVGLSSWSYSMWFNPSVINSSGTYTSLFAKSLLATNIGRFFLLLNGNKLNAGFDAGVGGANVISVLSTSTFNANNWYHVIFILDRNDKIKIYINGVLETLTIDTGNNNLIPYSSVNYSTNNPLRIGAYAAADNSTPALFFNGKIAAFSTYNRVLTQTEITQNFNATKSRFGL